MNTNYKSHELEYILNSLNPGYDYQKIGEFFSKHYQKDENRNSYPCDRFVFKALEMEFKNAVFSVADSPQKALTEAKYILIILRNCVRKQKRILIRK